MDEKYNIIISLIGSLLIVLVALFFFLMKSCLQNMHDSLRMVIDDIDDYKFLYEDEDVIAIRFGNMKVNLWKRKERFSIHGLLSSFCYYPNKMDSLIRWYPFVRRIEKSVYYALMDLNDRRKHESQ